jgi:hypothetical protein
MSIGIGLWRFLWFYRRVAPLYSGITGVLGGEDEKVFCGSYGGSFACRPRSHG